MPATIQHRYFRIAVPLVLVCLSTPLNGQPTPDAQAQLRFTRLSAYYPAGDAERGKALAVQCQACHVEGAPPMGDPPVHPPRLRHQRASSIFYALQDYKTGQRRNPVMRTVAQSLGDQNMRDLAVYLAGQRAPIPKASFTAAHDQAASLCAFCHGETGLGEIDGYPVLTGQHPDYLEKALADYRSGSRSNSTMSVIAREITQEQSHDIAEYFGAYSGLESIPTESPVP